MSAIEKVEIREIITTWFTVKNEPSDDNFSQFSFFTTPH